MAKIVCEAIVSVEAELAASPGAISEFYVIQLGLKLPNVLTENQMSKGLDEAAVSEKCPADYQAFLRLAKTSTLLGVSGSAP